MYKTAVTIWFDFYQEKTGQRYVFEAKDGKSLKSLLKKIETKVIEKNLEPNEENILNSLRGFLSSLKDQWILENLELTLVNSKFNVIYAKAIKNNPFTRAESISDIIRAKYGTGSERATG